MPTPIEPLTMLNPDAEDAQEPESDRKMDPELLCLKQILRNLKDLDEPARRRVMTYLSSRFAN